MSLLLKFIEIDSFASINKPVKLYLDEQITVLVGANDHGKSNLLYAIECLNDDVGLDDEDLYCGKDPRVVGAGKPPLPEIGFGFQIPQDIVQPTLEAMLTSNYEWPKGVDEAAAISVRQYLADLRVLPQTVDMTLIKCNGVGLGVWYRCPTFAAPAAVRGILGRIFVDITISLKPEVLFFEGPPTLPYKIPSDAFVNTDDPVLSGLLKLAKCEDRSAQLGSPENIGRRTRVDFNENLTKAFEVVYSQHKGIEWKIQLTDADTMLTLEISDHSRQLASPLEKSLGFRTFAAYLLSLISYTGTDNPTGYVIVIDEPDCHLHPRGQKDMLRYLESLSEENQIVYATHSPFMVPKSLPHRVRGIRRHDTGTTIDDKPYRGSWSEVVVDLGLAGADMFAFSDKYLVVEGVSDHLIVASLSAAFQARGWQALDLELIAVRSAETASNAHAVTLALTGPEARIVVLLDSDRAGDNAATKISKLKRSNVKTLLCKELTGADNSETEDLIPRAWIKPAMAEFIERLKGGKQVTDSQQKVALEELEKFEFTFPLKNSVVSFLVNQKLIESDKDYSPRLFGQCIAKVADDVTLTILESERKPIEKLFEVISAFLSPR